MRGGRLYCVVGAGSHSHSGSLFSGADVQNCVADEFVAPDPADSLFGLLCAGGGEMGDRIRRYDWSKTSLGPIERWSQAFKTALRLCMASWRTPNRMRGKTAK